MYACGHASWRYLQAHCQLRNTHKSLPGVTHAEVSLMLFSDCFNVPGVACLSGQERHKPSSPSGRRGWYRGGSHDVGDVAAVVWAPGCLWSLRVERLIRRSPPTLNCILFRCEPDLSEFEPHSQCRVDGVLHQVAIGKPILHTAVHGPEIAVEPLGESIVRNERDRRELTAAGRARGAGAPRQIPGREVALMIAVVGGVQVERV